MYLKVAISFRYLRCAKTSKQATLVYQEQNTAFPMRYSSFSQSLRNFSRVAEAIFREDSSSNLQLLAH